jgi:hypothetical protein
MNRKIAASIRPAVLIGVLVAAACGDNPAAPSETPSPPPTTPAVVPRSIAITGNTSLSRPGETSQLTATVTFADGTTRDVTGEAAWSGGYFEWGAVCTVSHGLVTAVSYGRALIQVQYPASSSGIGGHADAQVLPEGASLLTGQVTEGGFPLEQARVEVTSPWGTWTAMTYLNGSYRLPARGDVTVRAEKDGYGPAVKRITTERDEKLDFDLRRRDAPGDIRGLYALTFTASPSCTLPAEAMRRSYTARISEAGDQLIVDLSGADFMVWFEMPGFTGRREANAVSFTIASDLDAAYTVIERLDPAREIAFSGTATGTIEDRRIIAGYNGEVVVRTTGSPHNPLARCQAGDHRLEFVR